jgi:hypothetical protein
MSRVYPAIIIPVFSKYYMAEFPRPKPVEWFFLFCSLFLTLRYFGFQDDSFVFFRYVDNLLFLKAGLVYNEGEYVEGFSSPLWLMLLIMLRFIGLNYLFIVKGAAVACSIVFWLGLVKLNRMLSPEKSAIINLPLAFLSVNYGVTSFFSSGLESPLVQVLAVAYALFILAPGSRVLQLVVAASPLIRAEFALPLIVSLFWARMRGVKGLLRMAAAALLLNGAWLLFRIYYYAELVPNTFHLLDTVNIRQGLVYFDDTFGTYGVYPLLGLFALAALLRWNGAGFAPRLAMLVAAASYAVYSVKIGGSYFHYRHLAFPFCLVLCSFAGLAENAVLRLAPGKQLFPILCCLAIAAVSFSSYPPSLTAHPLSGSAEVRVVDGIADTLWERDTLGKYKELSVWEGFDGRLARVSETGWAGYGGVMASNWCETMYLRLTTDRAINTLGLTDAVLSRIDVEYSRPAHKWGLRPYAEDLRGIYPPGGEAGAGSFREAVGGGKAPAWVAGNIGVIDDVMRRVHNRHNLWENLQLAFASPGRMAVSSG